MTERNLLGALKHIDPSSLNYQEWINVGMALKESGYTAADWDQWSRSDARRYHSEECFKKWDTFRGSNSPVTAGTIIQMAKDQGWTSADDSSGYELDWNSSIGEKGDLVVVNQDWVEAREVEEPQVWDPVKELISYLEALFDTDDYVGYVTKSYEKDGKHIPSKGCYDRTAGKLIQELSRCGDDIGRVLGDYSPEAGAWIRFNPLDGKGVKNENVTEFRYALVESDSIPVEKQNAIIRELELPVAALVHSGGKSIHAIVRVEAGSYEEYRARVDYLYNVCKKNGLELDRQNRNPSRLSRMPGVLRKGSKQFLVATNIGKAGWNEWKEWVESINDDLPEPENLTSVWHDLPKLAEPLIDGVLRQGHKMLLAGPSKAGKSYALIELCCAIAEGRQWLSWGCTRGKILYVNLELDRASCLHRFKDVYQALGWRPDHMDNIDVWNLRGKSIPMDKLAPKLIRRAAKKNYIAIVIDPIYKVITGDENSADQMAHFCNQFDRVCTELGCSVVYCHHHSKGSQGGKRSMDRASGSGVFARDPDALIDLIELETTESLLRQEENKAVCRCCEAYLSTQIPDWKEELSQDDQCNERAMLDACRRLLSPQLYQRLIAEAEGVRKSVQSRTAWRIEGTLREFPKFQPVNLWFDYPVHHIDDSGFLNDVDPEGETPPWKKNFTKKKTPADRKKDRKEALNTAYLACSIDGDVTVEALSEFMGINEKTVRNHIKEHGGFWIDEGIVGKKP